MVVCIEQFMEEVVKGITKSELRVRGGCWVPEEGGCTTALNLHQTRSLTKCLHGWLDPWLCLPFALPRLGFLYQVQCMA